MILHKIKIHAKGLIHFLHGLYWSVIVMGREGELRGGDEYGWKEEGTKTSFKMQNSQTEPKASFL